VRGATYYVAAGTYPGYTFNTAVSGTNVVTVKKASVTEHGPSAGWQDNYASGVAQFNGQINVTRSYFVFDGVTGGGPGSWTNGLGFKVVVTSASPTIAINMSQFSASASDITFAHIETVGNDGSNQGGGSIANDAYAFYGQVSAIKVSYCYSHDMGRCHIFSSGQNVTIEYSCFGDYTSSAATHAEVMSIDPQLGSSVRNWTIRYCLFTHVEGTGGVMFNGQGMSFYGNVFYRPAGDAWVSGNGLVGGWTGANGEVMRDYLVYNNTFINVNTTVLTTLPQTFSGCAAWNNIFYNCSTPSFVKFTSHNYNHFINSGGTGGEANGTSAASGDPFVDYANLDFRLKAATAAGSNLGPPYNLDPYGRTRGTDGVWDRGAFEFGTALTNAAISVAPANLDFGLVQTNRSRDLVLTVKNVGIGTLTGMCSATAPFSIVSGGAYSLGAGQSQLVTVRYSPIVAGSNSQIVMLTGGGGATLVASGVATTTNANRAPVVADITHNGADINLVTPGLQIFEQTTIQCSGSASDPEGDPLTWQWIYSVNGGAEVVYQSGGGTVAPVSFTYESGTAGDTYVWKLRVSDGSASGESQLAVTVVAPPAAGNGVNFEAESGVLTAPLVGASGYISQPSTTGVTDGGRATYSFTITNAGDYVIQALVNAPSLTENSFYVSIDAEPQDPSMTWDVLPPTTGFENRLISWRGNGTADANEIVPKKFNLEVGPHQLIFRGREANTQLDRFTLIRIMTPPSNLTATGL